MTNIHVLYSKYFFITFLILLISQMVNQLAYVWMIN